MNRIAVVILNYNGKTLLQQFLPLVAQCSAGAQMIVADNGSSDGSGEWVEQHCPEARLVRIPRNLGFCGGYNYALQKVEAEYYVLLNSDIEVTPRWLEAVIALMDSDPAIGAAQPKIRSYAKRGDFEHAGAAGGFIDAWGYPFCRGRIFSAIEQDLGQYDDTVDVFWATGACLFIRAELFKKLGGFDEDFFAHMEEVDLCWRLKRLGYRTVCCGQSWVYHVGGATLPTSSHIKTYYNFRNDLAMLIKNLPARRLARCILIRPLLDGVAALTFLLEGHPRDAFAVLKAYAYLIKNALLLCRKRVYCQRSLPPLATPDLIYPRSIVADYYLLGKRRYTELRLSEANAQAATV